MMKIRIKTSNKIAFFLPVPYTILKTANTIFTSEKFRKQMHKWANQDLEQKHFPAWLSYTLLNKKLMNEIICELSKHKGTVLVDVRLHDGTEVTVKL